jgi:hypothetical protein
MFELRKSLSLHYLEDPQTNTPHSNTTGKNHVLKQEKKYRFFSFFFTQQRKSTIILFFQTSLLFMADWSGSFTEKTENTLHVRVFLV